MEDEAGVGRESHALAENSEVRLSYYEGVVVREDG